MTILVHHLHSPGYIKNTAVATIKNIAVFATGVTLLAELDSEVPIVVERFEVVAPYTPPLSLDSDSASADEDPFPLPPLPFPPRHLDFVLLELFEDNLDVLELPFPFEDDLDNFDDLPTFEGCGEGTEVGEQEGTVEGLDDTDGFALGIVEGLDDTDGFALGTVEGLDDTDGFALGTMELDGLDDTDGFALGTMETVGSAAANPTALITVKSVRAER